MTSNLTLPNLPRFEQFSANQLFQLWPFPALEISPDGSRVAYSVNTSGQFNLWVQKIDGGIPRQLTLFSDETVRSLLWSPDGTNLVFIADKDGDEAYQLYSIPAKGGWPEKLTGNSSAQYMPGGYSPDGSRLAYLTNERDQSRLELVVRDFKDQKEKRNNKSGRLNFENWHPDGKRVLIKQFISNSNNNLYFGNLDSELELLTPHEGDTSYQPAGWSSDGQSLYLISNEGREFKGLAVLSLTSKTFKFLETPDWDVENAVVSGDGGTLAWVVNEEGYSILHARDLQSGKDLPLPRIPKGVIAKLSISKSGQRLVFFLSRATHPAEVYLVDFEKGISKALTESALGGLDEEELVEPEVIRFTSFDGLKIPAFLYKPRKLEGKTPVLVSVHGGPEMQERPDSGPFYPGLYQYFLSRGVAVLATNIRGSTGYGKSYQKLIHRDWGGGELEDIREGVKYLHSLDWVDPAKIGVFGASFGGFATLSSVTRLPDLWKVGVDWFGISNLLSFVQTVPPAWRESIAKWVGDPVKDKDILIERSPITYVEQVKVPLLILQGSKDWRVVKSESDQIVLRLRELGCKVEYMVFEDEGHGFLRLENLKAALKATVDWLEKELLD